MKASEECVNLIKSFEGFSLKAYKCPAGVLTIGWGHTKNVMPNQTITEETALQLLREDLRPAEQCINNLKVKLRQGQFDALVSFVFNIGACAFRSSTVCFCIMKGYSDASVADLMIKWVYSKGRVLPGLLKRRAAEANLYLGEQKYTVKGTCIVKKNNR